MKHADKTQKLPLLKLILVGLALSAVVASVAQSFPTPSEPWLSKKGIGNDTQATNYYTAIGAPATFADWEGTYFTGPDEAHAIYYNSGDLGFGRDMHCRSSTATLACYVVNHGFGGPGGPPGLAVNDAIDNKNTLARVAMVYDRANEGQPNDVTFYVYDENGNRLNKVALDSEGAKFVPQLCQACHGGTYDETSNSISEVNFLPFDLTAFKYSTRAGYTRAAQEGQFRKLNEMVLGTLGTDPDYSPNLRIRELIEGWYGGAGLPRGTQDTNFVPPGYAGDPALYRNVVKPYCQTCHVAQKNFSLKNPAEVALARGDVFSLYIMPHAERAAHNFWTSTAPAFLANNRGWSIQVTRLEDLEPQPELCPPPILDCTPREAIINANNNPGSIITFPVNGTTTLTRSGEDDNASFGDLDITQSVTLLGNGAGNTIIDGGGIDRVFDINFGANVVMQGLTVQGGSADFGAGILSSGFDTKLTLNSSVVKNNTAGSGAGITIDNSTAEINASTIGPNNSATSPSTGFGGGIHSALSTLAVNNSTISGNTASSEGGGIENAGGQLTVRNSTITLNNASVSAGGIDNYQATANIQNSIVAGNSGGGSTDCANTNNGVINSQGYNLVGQNGSPNGCPKVSTDLVLAGNISTAINTILQGSPPYHALVTGSPAIDAIPRGAKCIPPSYDQRNVARPLDGDTDTGRIAACDIGAYEVSVPPPPNLLKNASFELDADADTRPDNWTINSKFTRSNASPPVAGRFVGRLRATDNTGATIQQTVKVSAGTTYNFAGWTKIPATGDAFTFTLQVQWINSSGGVLSTSVIKSYTESTSGSWNKAAGSWVAPAGAVTARIQIVVSSLNGTIYVDQYEFRLG